jgi:hypothetical protein
MLFFPLVLATFPSPSQLLRRDVHNSVAQPFCIQCRSMNVVSTEPSMKAE